MEIRGLRVNMRKTKLTVNEASGTEPVQLGRYSCGVCGRAVGVNFITRNATSGITRDIADNAV